jgi:trimeric autotransporter adhesin
MLYLLARTGSIALGLLLAVQSVAIAQEEPVVSAKPAAKVKPQFKIRYSNDGGDFRGRGLGQVETFVPLGQTPGQSVTFGEAKLNLDEHLGGNLRVGYRQMLPGANRIVGGYLGYDYRSTGSATFGQLGLGFETLGDVWDLRLNGYLPMGQTRREVGRSATPWVTTGTGGLVNTGNVAFQGNGLQEIWQQNDRNDRTVTTVNHAALGGVELEGGARVLRFDNGGDLRAYGGVYSLSGQGTDSAIGWKFRLAAKPTSGLTMGLGVQSDAIFGTNVLFNIGYGWPNTLPKGKADRLADVVARLGDGVERRDRIAVDRQVKQWSETIATTSEQFVPLTNPATGQPWFFNHVVAGGTGGNGTAENPFQVSNLQSVLDGTPQDGNGVVYVAKGTGPIEGFTVPGGIRVLSQGPVQLLSVVERDGSVQLPGSGQGVGANPWVLGGETVVRVGSSPDFPTVLSGFDVRSANNATSANTLGISIGETQGEVRILNNRISDVDFGIEQSSGSTPTGSLLIDNNDINADDSGIGIMAGSNGEDAVIVNGASQISNNRITTPLYGISIGAGGAGVLNGNIAILDNDISAGEVGILATAVEGGQLNSNLTIDNNDIQLTPSASDNIAGISVEVRQPNPLIEGAPSLIGSDFIAITNNRISSTTRADSGVAVMLDDALTPASAFEAFPTIATNIIVSNNIFLLPVDPPHDNQASGVTFGLDKMVFSGNLTISNNRGTVAEDGIRYNLSDTGILDGIITIEANSITPGPDNHAVGFCDAGMGTGDVVSDALDSVDACPPDEP